MLIAIQYNNKGDSPKNSVLKIYQSIYLTVFNGNWKMFTFEVFNILEKITQKCSSEGRGKKYFKRSSSKINS